MQRFCGIFIQVVVFLNEIELFIQELQLQLEKFIKNTHPICQFRQISHFYQPLVSIDEMSANLQDSGLEEFEIF